MHTLNKIKTILGAVLLLLIASTATSTLAQAQDAPPRKVIAIAAQYDKFAGDISMETLLYLFSQDKMQDEQYRVEVQHRTKGTTPIKKTTNVISFYGCTCATPDPQFKLAGTMSLGVNEEVIAIQIQKLTFSGGLVNVELK